MSKRFISVLAVISALILPIQGLAAEEEINLFAKVNGAPKHYQDDAGQSRGYAIDIALEALVRAGYKVNVIHTSWKRAQSLASRGNGVITAFSKTPKREINYYFTDPLFIDRVLLVQRSTGVFPFKEFSDLEGKFIGISRGSEYAGEFTKVRDALFLDEDSDSAHRLNKLLAGRIDAAIFSGDVFDVRYNVQKAKSDMSLLHISEKPIALDPNHLGVPMNLKSSNPQKLIERFNQALQEMKSSGRVAEIRSQYR